MATKPFSLLEKETEDKIRDAINESCLHPTVIRLMLANILADIMRSEEIYAAQEKKNYEEQTTKESKQTETAQEVKKK